MYYCYGCGQYIYPGTQLHTCPGRTSIPVITYNYPIIDNTEVIKKLDEIIKLLKGKKVK